LKANVVKKRNEKRKKQKGEEEGREEGREKREGEEGEGEERD